MNAAGGYHFRMVRRLLSTLLIAAVSLALLAPAALAAADHGEGLWGETDDKVVTNAGFLLIAFFPALALVLSLLQGRLDRRKAARKAAHKSSDGSGDRRGGW